MQTQLHQPHQWYTSRYLIIYISRYLDTGVSTAIICLHPSWWRQFLPWSSDHLSIMTQLLLHDSRLETRGRWRDEQKHYPCIKWLSIIIICYLCWKKMTWSHSQLVVYLFIILQKIKSGSSTSRRALEQSTPPQSSIHRPGQLRVQSPVRQTLPETRHSRYKVSAG